MSKIFWFDSYSAWRRCWYFFFPLRFITYVVFCLHVCLHARRGHYGQDFFLKHCFLQQSVTPPTFQWVRGLWGGLHWLSYMLIFTPQSFHVISLLWSPGSQVSWSLGEKVNTIRYIARFYTSPTRCLPRTCQVLLNHSGSGMISSWVVSGGVLSENDSKNCKKQNRETQASNVDTSCLARISVVPGLSSSKKTVSYPAASVAGASESSRVP